MTRRGKIKAQPFDCMQYFYRAVQEPLIRCYIQFTGTVNLAALKRAVDLSISAVPVIGCTFDGGSHCWRRQDFSADDIVRTCDGDEKTAQKLLLSSIDFEREPQLKIDLVRQGDHDTLCVIINHMVCDGAGFKDYLYLLAGLYSRCAHDTAYCVKPAPLGERNLGQLLHPLSMKQKRHILLAASQPHKPESGMVMPLHGDLSNPVIIIRSIEPEQCITIKQFAKSAHVSLNDIFLTAYVRALYLVTGCSRVTVPCPVDLRKYRADGQICGICNLTSNYYCDVTLQPEEAFADTLKQVSGQLRAQKESDECLKGPMLFSALYHLLPIGALQKIFYKISPVPVTSYTNLGILDDGKFRFGELSIANAFLSTAVKKAPYFQLSISTYGGRATLTSSLYATDGDQKMVEGFLDSIILECVNAVSN